MNNGERCECRQHQLTGTNSVQLLLLRLLLNESPCTDDDFIMTKSSSSLVNLNGEGSFSWSDCTEVFLFSSVAGKSACMHAFTSALTVKSEESHRARSGTHETGRSRVKYI